MSRKVVATGLNVDWGMVTKLVEANPELGRMPIGDFLTIGSFFAAEVGLQCQGPASFGAAQPSSKKFAAQVRAHKSPQDLRLVN